MDIADIPNNVHDFVKYIDTKMAELKKFDEKTQKQILDGSNADVAKLINQIVMTQLKAQGLIKEEIKTEIKEENK